MPEQNAAIRNFPSINEVVTDPARLIANPAIVSAPGFANEGNLMTSMVCKGNCNSAKKATCPFAQKNNT